MSSGEEVRKLQLMDDCTRIFAGPYRSVKQLYIENEWEFRSANVEMNQRLLDALEYVDNTFECIADGNPDEAEEWIETLEDHACRAACDAARALAERERDELQQQRYRSNRLYSMLLFSSVPTCDEHHHTCNRIDEMLAEGQRLEDSRWENAFDKYNDATNEAKKLSNRTPQKATVRKRLLTLAAAVFGIVAGIELAWGVLPQVPFPMV